MTAATHPAFLPRYLHMMVGALAVGGVYVALAGRFRAERAPALAAKAQDVGLCTFFWATLVNVPIGFWYLLALPREVMLLFMGGNLPATLCFLLSLVLIVGMLIVAWKRKFQAALWNAVAMIILMSFMRAWQRAGYLQDVGQGSDGR
jgi:hypothetical protein